MQGVQNNIGYLFQRDALLPWKTAYQNVELGVLFRGVSEHERRTKVLAWLEKSWPEGGLKSAFRINFQADNANVSRWRRRL